MDCLLSFFNRSVKSFPSYISDAALRDQLKRKWKQEIDLLLRIRERRTVTISVASGSNKCCEKSARLKRGCLTICSKNVYCSLSLT